VFRGLLPRDICRTTTQKHPGGENAVPQASSHHEWFPSLPEVNIS
jgi:hypothetical protein